MALKPGTARDSDDSLYLGWLGNLPSLPDLQQRAGFTLHEAAAALLVSPETYRRWRSDRKPNPTAVRLLAVLAGYVPWQGWQGWEVHRGLLFPPGYRRNGISAGDLYAWPFERQMLAELRRQLKALPLETDPLGGRGDVNPDRRSPPVGVAQRSR
jgi:transcriptional regulator with XRE-family HTH domain